MSEEDFSKRLRRADSNQVDAYSRHKQYINDYVKYYGTKDTRETLLWHADIHRAAETSKEPTRRDIDIVKDNYQFIHEDDEETEEAAALTEAQIWERRVAKKYYDKLFKEYALVDLSHYKVGKIAMRWRTESEVKSGKGQFECASLRCPSGEDLASWEVNFAYTEQGERKNALVKVRLCPECSGKLNYQKQSVKVRDEDERARDRSVSPGDRNAHKAKDS